MHASSPVCYAFLRYTSSATPADLLLAIMAAELFLIHILAQYIDLQALVGLETRTEHAAAQCVTHALPNEPNWLGYAIKLIYWDIS